MAIEFSPGLTFALQRAAAYACRAAAARVELEHLLAGLLHEEEGSCVALLTRAGLNFARFRAAYPAVADEPPETLLLSQAVGGLIGDLGREVRWHQEEQTLTSDRVLLALLRADAAARTLLEAFGLDMARLAPAPEEHVVALDEPLDLSEPSATFELARLLDAAANRAREALRVLEDYTRFVLNDALLMEQLKGIRHDLATALGELPAGLLLAARDTPHDVGTSVTALGEDRRESFADVLTANSKRLQEALRSLEEYGKIRRPELGQALESLRYRAYALEPALCGAAESRARLAEAKLYVLVSEAQCQASLPGTVAEMLAGGAQIIQLREKSQSDRAILEEAREVRRLTRQARALFIMNDRPDLAVLAEADGVHLGQDDVTVRQARSIVGDKALIGVSTHTLTQVRQAVLDGANYLGVGPTFPSKTKDFSAFAGLDFVRAAAAATSLPFFVLGGVTAENVSQVLAAGGTRVAVGHAVCASDDPRREAGRLRRVLDGQGSAST